MIGIFSVFINQVFDGKIEILEFNSRSKHGDCVHTEPQNQISKNRYWKSKAPTGWREENSPMKKPPNPKREEKESAINLINYILIWNEGENFRVCL
jgi:hypothetical protein